VRARRAGAPAKPLSYDNTGSEARGSGGVHQRNIRGRITKQENAVLTVIGKRIPQELHVVAVKFSAVAAECRARDATVPPPKVRINRFELRILEFL
jgi:hypothetical protein